MKELIGLFIKKNWFKIGVALFLSVVAFQEELSFNIDLSMPAQGPIRPESIDLEANQGEILSTKESDLKEHKRENRFHLQPFLPRWRKKTDAAKAQKKPEKDRVRALTKLASIDPEALDVFIRRFTHVAIGEQKKFGIPASITIANGLLMSTANHSVLAQDYQNFFRLPCTPNWDGQQAFKDGNCYRVYQTAWLSFRDHSNHLKQLREGRKTTLGNTDYKAWAKFLKAVHFGDEPDIDQQLIQLIEDMELFYLDNS